MMLANALMIVGCLLMALSPESYTLMAGRFIVGLSCGVSTVSVPVFLADIAPLSVRGLVVTISQMGIAAV
jgi:MFS family permease